MPAELPLALVTGGSSGIGRACALALAASHEVWLSYRSRRDRAEEVLRAIAAAGGRGEALELDLDDPASIERARERLARRCGERGDRLALLVSNAGTAGTGYRLLLEIEEAEWDAVWRTNVSGPARLLERLDGVLAADAVVVHVDTLVSRAGAIGHKSHAHYPASKAAMAALASARSERPGAGRRRAARVVVGLVDTELLRGHMGQDLEPYAASVPLGRLGRTDEVAAAVVQLAGAAGRGLTSPEIAVDGGLLARGWRRVGQVERRRTR